MELKNKTKSNKGAIPKNDRKLPREEEDRIKSEISALQQDPKVSVKVIFPTVAFDWNDDYRGYGLVSIIRKGIDYKTFLLVAKTAPLNDSDWALILDTTTRTLERYKKANKVFSPTQTEKIIQIQQLMQYGIKVFEDNDNFHAWLIRENVALGNIVPKKLLDTSVGLGMVKDALGRIEHGIFA